MAAKASVKPVLLSGEQMSAILQIQRQEKQKSPLGITPSIHEIARGLVGKALSNMAVG
ncbi:hypothetical protein RDT67_14520 [Serratia fonticola]|jgi:hypothetical protein|uniref:Uncharacterized protein n=1 Tax=Serratia fonticola TaxID=47917 RepID=A0AAJ2DA07_SERFO|nr:hypothetical protein [Serratia fonticola]MDQ9127644.1 hypothetical protein [Serratia fonticola]